ncbi:MAG: HPF/RaiA family ribosome-associated protein [Acidobacteriota bacterium]|nr:HPF/RaiA family ribosome-associated protein [Acidobacteriota bacterium]
MQHMIACEDFELTPAIREHVEANVAAITEALPKNEQVRVFLSHPSKREFTALFKVHAWHREIVATDTSDNLYKAVNKARSNMIRKVHDLKERKVGARHNPGPTIGEFV